MAQLQEYLNTQTKSIQRLEIIPSTKMKMTSDLLWKANNMIL